MSKTIGYIVVGIHEMATVLKVPRQAESMTCHHQIHTEVASVEVGCYIKTVAVWQYIDIG